MLAKDNCLKRKRDFERIFKKGKSFKGAFLVLKIAPNDLAEDRFGIIVSKRVSKKAVIRNKIKRRIRASLRTRISPLRKLKKGKDIILVATPGLEKKDFWEIEEIIKKLFERAGLN